MGILDFFGISLKDKKEKIPKSVVQPETDDGSLVVETGFGGAFHQSSIQFGITAKTEFELIHQYRNLALEPEVDGAIDDIIDEAIVVEQNKPSVSIVLDSLDIGESLKDKIREEFDNVLKLLKFTDKSYDIFKQWYIEGRLYHHIIVDEDKQSNGIIEVRPIDATSIKKIKEIVKAPMKDGVEEIKEINEFFIYTPRPIQLGINNIRSNQIIDPIQPTTAIKVNLDAISYVHSGFLDKQKQIVLSYLHKAVKPMNQLRMLEDSVVIYRLSRAPERRVFYIDVGTLQPKKAEEYMQSVITNYKNKFVYNATTGELTDKRNQISAIEDFFLARREGGKGTEVTTLPGGENLGELADLNFFKIRLYKSLNVPSTRLEAESTFNLGRASEITRDELKFSKFINRLRKRFSKLFSNILRVQLITKKIIRTDEWKEYNEAIYYDFISDAHFAELKNAELLRERLGLLNEVDSYVGKFFSKEWISKNILMQTDEEIEEMKKQIDKETEDDEIRKFEPEIDQAFPGGQPPAPEEEELPPEDSGVPIDPGTGPEPFEEPDTQPNDKEAGKNEVK